MNEKQLAVLHLIEAALEDIADELAKEQDLVADRRTLVAFQRELQAMESEIKANQMPPSQQRRRGMGRVIADSWPLSSALGLKVTSAEQRYLAL